MMDQNNYGLFGIFFFMDLFFWSIIFQKTVSRKIDPPLRSVAVREARARRARSARRPLVAGEKFFFWGFFCKNKILLISKILLFSWRILRAL